ncbi:glycine betaine ABC transporter substrate-binding protein [Salinivirga cyanobacteriivorans]|uniref:glycine betaine ABC transporter substrate-binding protein n=1 Tax=Salinivirga cyanobacteriivorans TaxID=1307839 RepID=UPI001969F5CB|nr:glycine betaine ABC transporter substrate-binding protein [Salinivirga cyanobacteriivorans]
MKNSKGDPIILYYGNWIETMAMSKVTALALNDVGIPAKAVLLEPGLIYTSLARGDGDILLECWLPQTSKHYWEKYKDQLDTVGISFDYASTGLVVPQYVSIDSISQLNDFANRFDHRIVGIGSGAGVYKDTEEAIEVYDLDFKQITSSDAAMMASLKRAITRSEWIVVTGWKPHYKWALYDLKYLIDSRHVYAHETSYIVTRKGFVKGQPGFKTFLKNMYFDQKQLAELMLLFANAEDEDLVAKEWYRANKQMIQSWMPKDWLQNQLE